MNPEVLQPKPNPQPKPKFCLHAFLRKQNPPAILLVKAIVLALVFLVNFLVVFLVREHITNQGYTDGTMVEKTGFIDIYITYNPGIAFSIGSSSPAFVYAIQAIVFVIVLGAFVCLRHYEQIVALLFVASGALANIIDRATSVYLTANHPDAVLDYFRFWFGGAIFNYADICIVVGFIVFFIATFVRVVYQWRKDDQHNKSQQPSPPCPDR